MTEYQAIYKCRLCGEKYIGAKIDNKNVAFYGMRVLIRKECFYSKSSGIGVHRIDCHTCKDGSFGMADFQGFRKVE